MRRGNPIAALFAVLLGIAGMSIGSPVLTAAPTYQGTLAYADPGFGPLYLAIPEPRGTVVRICGPADCVTRTSTDVGPALELQRAGRIADVSATDFEIVCGVPLALGLCPGSVTVLERPHRPTLPPTDTE